MLLLYAAVSVVGKLHLDWFSSGPSSALLVLPIISTFHGHQDHRWQTAHPKWPVHPYSCNSISIMRCMSKQLIKALYQHTTLTTRRSTYSNPLQATRCKHERDHHGNSVQQQDGARMMSSHPDHHHSTRRLRSAVSVSC